MTPLNSTVILSVTFFSMSCMPFAFQKKMFTISQKRIESENLKGVFLCPLRGIKGKTETKSSAIDAISPVDPIKFEHEHLITKSCKSKKDNAFSLFLHNWKKYHTKRVAVGTVSREDNGSAFGQEYLSCSQPDLPFLEWLIGFTEGDGCFFINNRNSLAFVLIQGEASLPVLKTIKEKLGMGRIIKQGKRVFRFIIEKRDEIQLIIYLFNGNLVLASRKTQFKKFFDCFLEKRNKKKGPWLLDFVCFKGKPVFYLNRFNIPSPSSLWLLGFTEAEGCFTISFLFSSHVFRTRFIISQKGDENVKTLSSLILFFGVGRIEAHSVKQNYSYIVSGLKNVKKVYNYFDSNLEHFLGNKKNSYLKWKDINRKIEQKEHLDKEKRRVLIETAKQINSVSRKSK